MSTFIAISNIYGKNFMVRNLTAKNFNDAKREAFARFFCTAIHVEVSDAFAGSPEECKALMDSVPVTELERFCQSCHADEHDREMFIHSCAIIQSKIKVLEVFSLEHVDLSAMNVEWNGAMYDRYKALHTSNTKAEIDRLSNEIAQKQKEMDDLKKKL